MLLCIHRVVLDGTYTLTRHVDSRFYNSKLYTAQSSVALVWCGVTMASCVL